MAVMESTESQFSNFLVRELSTKFLTELIPVLFLLNFVVLESSVEEVLEGG